MSNQLPFELFLITLLELGDATSRNLEFAHRKDVHVSLGEEATTEHNLLEIRRRHWDSTRIETFPKPKEAKNGGRLGMALDRPSVHPQVAGTSETRPMR